MLAELSPSSAVKSRPPFPVGFDMQARNCLRVAALASASPRVSDGACHQAGVAGALRLAPFRLAGPGRGQQKQRPRCLQNFGC
jgi:hypothetical protein